MLSKKFAWFLQMIMKLYVLKEHGIVKVAQ